MSADIIQRVVAPPQSNPLADGSVDGGWWHQPKSTEDDSGRIVCDLCPRECHMKPGDRGFCFVRKNVDGRMQLTTYGRSTGFCIDPIEKKPLNHFYPGTAVLSFGTAGCNLGCKFCQNWDISKSREVARLSELALPDMIAAAATETGCRSVAYTYNDPVIWAEYAIDTAKACRDVGVKSVAVTAGYISADARPAFFEYMDAANIDLKSFSQEFYETITYSRLQPVLDTLVWLQQESDVWFEITNLIIPDANDSNDELRRMCDWILDTIGADVPLHFTAFHPDFRMKDRPRTPHETLLTARQVAIERGLKFVYVGNVHDPQHQSTFCPACNGLLIERDWHQLGQYSLNRSHCGHCGAGVPGRFDDAPGTWGRKRQPIRISDFSRESQPADLAPQAVAERLDTTTQLNHQRSESETTSMNDNVTDRPQLSDEQESAIHRAACEIVAAAVHNQSLRLAEPTLSASADLIVMGIFVTLKRDGQLRGCCGTLGQPMALLPALRHSGKRTAVEDRRFPPVSPSELPFLTLDVTLLFNFEPITLPGEDRVSAIEIGRHGLRIARGNKAGLLLPIVAVEHQWDEETFLNQVCVKAGLPVTAWQQQDTHLERFEGRLIERPFDAATLEAVQESSTGPVTQAEVNTLNRFAHRNIITQLQGGVPACFPTNISDGTVFGIGLSISFTNSDQQATFVKLQLRDGFPLQTSLLNLTESAARWLHSGQFNPAAANTIQTDLILLADVAMHGTVGKPELSGVNTEHRAVIVRDSNRTACCFHRNSSAQQLVESAADAAGLAPSKSAQVLSMGAVSTCDEFRYSNVPRPQVGSEVRPPAVAGTFYPDEVDALKQVVRECCAGGSAEKTNRPAVMIPHAGLRFSGRIAAAVLQQIEIPDRVIIIGPKHTRQGVEWAVAPHTTWQLPGGSVDSDPELARQLVDRIDGLELDSAAHAAEHCIEVELPLLAHIAPGTKVVGIAIGGGSPERLRQFGRQLAELISEMERAPLLVISSDMNHFASDAENRRLDEMALTAMESLDPQHLYDVVTSNRISMCGILPAVIVMETLRQLNQLSQMTRAGYATSADVSGDNSRVVGYAGMLLG